MDLPILKHLDTLIGLAVVMLITSTVVVAVTQFILSSLSARSRHLKEMLAALVAQLAPKLTSDEVKYIAERLLRNQLVGRQRQWFDRAPKEKEAGLPLPALARGEVILRHEIILSLIEWAAGEGQLAKQDEDLAKAQPDSKDGVAKIVDKLKKALNQAGITDPVKAASDIRTAAAKLEASNPELAAELRHTKAIVGAGLGDLTGKVFSWYDNSMDRVTEFFSIEAKFVTSVLALVVCVVIQLDSIDLLRRLSQDEKLRSALVAQAQTAQKSYESISASAPSGEKDARRENAEKAIRESVEALRDPKASVIPDYFLWDQVAQLRVESIGANAAKYVLRVDSRSFEAPVGLACVAPFPACPLEALKTILPPTDVHVEGGSLVLSARSTSVSSIALEAVDAGGSKVDIKAAASRAWDGAGFVRRFPGVVVSWILVSLGAPFWYDLLKKLLGLRSILQSKDDAERENRRNEGKGTDTKKA